MRGGSMHNSCDQKRFVCSLCVHPVSSFFLHICARWRFPYGFSEFLCVCVHGNAFSLSLSISHCRKQILTNRYIPYTLVRKSITFELGAACVIPGSSLPTSPSPKCSRLCVCLDAHVRFWHAGPAAAAYRAMCCACVCVCKQHKSTAALTLLSPTAITIQLTAIR